MTGAPSGASARADRGRPYRTPRAIVLGSTGIEIVRPLSMAGVRCGIVAPAGDSAGRSRFAEDLFTWDWSQEMGRHGRVVAERLLEYGRHCAEPPVLFYCEDYPMVFVSRHRRELEQGFRFVVPEEGLLEDLVDKTRFTALAARHDLPVPPTRTLTPDSRSPPAEVAEIGFPLMLKPRQVDLRWLSVVGHAKAVRVDTVGQLRALWPRLTAVRAPILAQRYIEGPESRIESYHVYVDRAGEVAAEFTGRKIRTLPAEYGFTSALVVTTDPSLCALGRDVVRRLDLRGVAKLDFKRDPEGQLHLLEINPRFNLWHHAGAVAGVNIPAVVYADLAGRARPRMAARPRGVSWCHPKDVIAARRHGVPFLPWLRWAMGSDVKAFWSWTDPLPLFHAVGRRAWTRLPLPARRTTE